MAVRLKVMIGRAWTYGSVATLSATLAAILTGCSLSGCSPSAGHPAPPPSAPPSLPSASAPSLSSATSHSVEAPATAPVVEPADALLSLAAYRPRVERLIVGEQGELLPASLDGTRLPPIGHRVITVADRPGTPPIHMVTVGFGRRSQPHVFGTTPRYVELVASAHRDDPAVREALSTLGRFLHAADRPISVRFQAFDTIRTDEPILGERFFALVPSDLVPGGELALGDDLSVTLLQVIPMDEDDFIVMNMRGDGAVRAWWTAHRGSRELLHRWDDVMAQRE